MQQSNDLLLCWEGSQGLLEKMLDAVWKAIEVALYACHFFGAFRR